MSENKIKEQETKEPEVQPAAKKKSYKSTRKFLRFVNVFGGMSRNQIVNAIPFLLFITLLLMVYISNSYYAESIIRDIDKTKKELKEKRAEYITTMSRLMYVSNQSEVARLLANYGVKESVDPAVKIYAAPEKKK